MNGLGRDDIWGGVLFILHLFYYFRRAGKLGEEAKQHCWRWKLLLACEFGLAGTVEATPPTLLIIKSIRLVCVYSEEKGEVRGSSSHIL